MSDLKVNLTTGDIDLTDGDFSIVSEKDAVEQHLRSNLRAFKSEWFLDLDAGLPYYQEVFRKNQSPVILDAIFKEAILKTTGVIELTEFDLKFDTVTRKLILNFAVTTADGDISFEGLVVE